MKKCKQILKISSIYAGAVLGAGFAGGRELITFFLNYGQKGIYAALGAGALFTIFGAIILYKAKENKCNTYSDFLNTMFGKKTAYLINAISNVFLFTCFVIMLSGSGALIKDCLNISPIYGSIATTVITYFVLSLDLKGIGTVCSFLTPIMVIGILLTDILALFAFPTSTYALADHSSKGFFLSAILYVSYNMLSCAPALASSTQLSENKRTAFWGGAFGGIALMIILYATCSVLSFSSHEIINAELPMLSLAKRHSNTLYYAYTLILYMAILTTSISTGMPITKSAEGFNLSRKASSFILCAVSLPLSFFKFSVLVKYCYTAFGYLGLLLLIKIILTFRKTKE